MNILTVTFEKNAQNRRLCQPWPQISRLTNFIHSGPFESQPTSKIFSLANEIAKGKMFWNSITMSTYFVLNPLRILFRVFCFPVIVMKISQYRKTHTASRLKIMRVCDQF